MLKLYRLAGSKKDYWETWDNGDGTHTVHWGELGTHGQSKEIKGGLLKKPETVIQKEVDEMVAAGFRPAMKSSLFLSSIRSIAWDRKRMLRSAIASRTG